MFDSALVCWETCSPEIARVILEAPISQKIILNKTEIWNHADAGQLKCKVEFSKSALKKMNAACEHGKTMAEQLFEHEINNIPQSLCKDGKNGIELYHGSKAEISKWFLIHQVL